MARRLAVRQTLNFWHTGTQVRVGLSEQLVRRALAFMAQQDELEYRRERRLIHRKR